MKTPQRANAESDPQTFPEMSLLRATRSGIWARRNQMVGNHALKATSRSLAQMLRRQTSVTHSAKKGPARCCFYRPLVLGLNRGPAQSNRDTTHKATLQIVVLQQKKKKVLLQWFYTSLVRAGLVRVPGMEFTFSPTDQSALWILKIASNFRNFPFSTEHNLVGFLPKWPLE